MSITKLSLFKRYNGIYYITYQEDGSTKWKSTKKKLKHEALKVLSDFDDYLRHDSPTVSFHEFVHQFLSLRANYLRESTIRRIYLPAFNAFDSICGNKSVTAYTVKDVETFKSKRLETCSPTTVNIAFRALKGAFNCAIKWHLLIENPFEKSSQLRAPERFPTYLSKEDFKRLLCTVKEPELKDVFLFATFTGLRLGEITNLRWSSIDFQKRQILVENLDDFFTKTGKQRCVPMNETIINLLSRKELTQKFCVHVFQRRGVRLQHSYVSHKFKEYARALGLNDRLHFHSLRHTFATWLVHDGVNIYEVQKLLGHSSVKVTEVYSHLAAGELQDAVNKISLSAN